MKSSTNDFHTVNSNINGEILKLTIFRDLKDGGMGGYLLYMDA